MPVISSKPLSHRRTGRNHLSGHGQPKSNLYHYDAFTLTREREIELTSALTESGVLNSQSITDRVLLIVDELCQYAKCSHCPTARRSAIYHIKNRMLLLFWQKKRAIFHGVWQHSSKMSSQSCWQCNGTGIQKNTLQSCTKCEGSGFWKRGDKNILIVFAIDTGQYKTTWHFPSFIARNILKEVLPLGNDLVIQGSWNNDDRMKVPVEMPDDLYEEHRSFTAWYVRKAEAQTASK